MFAARCQLEGRFAVGRHYGVLEAPSSNTTT
jgi:hypothetical protein